MDIRFKLPSLLLQQIRTDLLKPHPFAAERVGFVSCGIGAIAGGIAVMANGYHPVDDDDYLDDPRYGAMMGSGAIRKALQFAYNNKAAMFHVHIHEHVGKPKFSRIDLAEYPKFIPDFWKVQPVLPHGALLLSEDRATALVWYPGLPQPQPVAEIWEIGTKMRKL